MLTWKQSFLALALAVWLGGDCACSFLLPSPSISRLGREVPLMAVRQPRRNLKKRKGRERKSPAFPSPGAKGDPSIWETKPLISSKQKEAGLDFWVDPKDLEREKQRQLAINNRKSMEGEITKEKLRAEVVAPYTQNWIGLISVMFIVLATIITNFPEVLDYPSIGFPDLEAGDPVPLQSTLKGAAQGVAGLLSE